jgi:ankyrin repeat protein
MLDTGIYEYALNALDTEDTKDGNGPIHKVVLQSYEDKPSAKEIEEMRKEGLEDDGRDDYEMLHFLLSTGKIELNKFNSHNQTPLALALHDLERVIILLDAGADINGKQGYNITPLMIASRDPEFFTEIDTMRFLLDRGAKVTYIDDDGETALFRTFNVDKIKLLLEYVLPESHLNYLNYKNSDGKTAYQVAEDAGEHDVCEYLKSIGATYGGKKGKKTTRKGKSRKKRRKTKGKR